MDRDAAGEEVDQYVHRLTEHLVEAVDQVALHDVHERIGRHGRIGRPGRIRRHEPVCEHQPVDRCTTERPRRQQCRRRPVVPGSRSHP
jgi:hypothetical protein